MFQSRFTRDRDVRMQVQVSEVTLHGDRTDHPFEMIIDDGRNTDINFMTRAELERLHEEILNALRQHDGILLNGSKI